MYVLYEKILEQCSDECVRGFLAECLEGGHVITLSGLRAFGCDVDGIDQQWFMDAASFLNLDRAARKELAYQGVSLSLLNEFDFVSSRAGDKQTFDPANARKVLELRVLNK